MLYEVITYGPLCMNIDVIRGAIQFPALNKGDQVVISRIGAYNMTQWMQFINYRPNVVMIDLNSKTHVIRKNEDHESMNSLDVVPTYFVITSYSIHYTKLYDCVITKQLVVNWRYLMVFSQ